MPVAWSRSALLLLAAVFAVIPGLAVSLQFRCPSLFLFTPLLLLRMSFVSCKRTQEPRSLRLRQVAWVYTSLEMIRDSGCRNP